MQSETNLVRACLIWLKAHGVMAWRNNVGCMTLRAPGVRSRFVRFGIVGASDIFGVLPVRGQFLAIEAKRHPNKPTYSQEVFLQEVRNHGGLAWVIYSIEELEKAWMGINEQIGSIVAR